MKKFITKKKMLAALETQNIGATRSFYDYNGEGKCAACALGAVFRGVFGTEYYLITDALDRETPRYAALSPGDVKSVDGHEVCKKPSVAKKEYLHALSFFYEGLMDKKQPIETVRKKCIGWVKRNVPDGYRMQISGYGA